MPKVKEQVHSPYNYSGGQPVFQPLPRIQSLPATLPLEGAVCIELEEGVPIFRASNAVQERVSKLLEKQHQGGLDAREETELDHYEEIDDYLSFANRVIRNLIQSEEDGGIK